MNLLRRNHVSHRAAALLAGTLGLVVLAVPACNNEEGTTGVRSAQIFAGTVSGDNATLSGSVVLNLTGTSVTGEITVVAPDDAAGTRVLTGLFGSDKKLTASDGTASGYKFSGTYDGTSRLDGTMTGPVISTTKPGPVTGSFITTQTSTAVSYCAGFTGTDVGVFNFAIDGSVLRGTATSTTGTVTALDGTVSGGTDISITNPANPTGPPFATGTITGDEVAGDFDDGAGSSGVWAGARCNASVLPFVGTVNGDNASLSGSIALYVSGTDVTGALKVIAPAPATLQLSGTYTASTKTVTASGGGYTFAGVYDAGAGRLDGTMSGTASGTFVAVRSRSAAGFCGTFTGTDDGTFNFAIDGTTLVGTATSTIGSVTPLDGTVSGTNITITNPGAPSGPPLAVGTISGTDVSGTFDDGAGSSGTWTGSKCN